MWHWNHVWKRNTHYPQSLKDTFWKLGNWAVNSLHALERKSLDGKAGGAQLCHFSSTTHPSASTLFMPGCYSSVPYVGPGNACLEFHKNQLNHIMMFYAVFFLKLLFKKSCAFVSVITIFSQRLYLMADSSSIHYSWKEKKFLRMPFLLSFSPLRLSLFSENAEAFSFVWIYLGFEC